MAGLLQKSLKLWSFRRGIGCSTRGKINQDHCRVHRALKPRAAANPEQLVTASVGHRDTQERHSQSDHESDCDSTHVVPPVDLQRGCTTSCGTIRDKGFELSARVNKANLTKMLRPPHDSVKDCYSTARPCSSIYEREKCMEEL